MTAALPGYRCEIKRSRLRTDRHLAGIDASARPGELREISHYRGVDISRAGRLIAPGCAREIRPKRGIKKAARAPLGFKGMRGLDYSGEFMA